MRETQRCERTYSAYKYFHVNKHKNAARFLPQGVVRKITVRSYASWDSSKPPGDSGARAGSARRLAASAAAVHVELLMDVGVFEVRIGPS